MTVGWHAELETFYARVLDGTGAVLARVGTSRLEITTISELQQALARWASFDGATVSALRHDATALWSTGSEPPARRPVQAPERLH